MAAEAGERKASAACRQRLWQATARLSASSARLKLAGLLIEVDAPMASSRYTRRVETPQPWARCKPQCHRGCGGLRLPPGCVLPGPATADHGHCHGAQEGLPCKRWFHQSVGLACVQRQSRARIRPVHPPGIARVATTQAGARSADSIAQARPSPPCAPRSRQRPTDPPDLARSPGPGITPPPASRREQDERVNATHCSALGIPAPRRTESSDSSPDALPLGAWVQSYQDKVEQHISHQKCNRD